MIVLIVPRIVGAHDMHFVIESEMNRATALVGAFPQVSGYDAK